MKHSEALDQLAAALSAAQAEFSAVPKESVNPFFKSNYAALPDVVKHATPVLTKQGLSDSQFIDEEDTLTTILLHQSGQWISATAKLHLVKDDPQAAGSAVTYMRRYAYMAVLGLVADTDDDGNAASQPAQRPQSRPQQQERPAPQQRSSEPQKPAQQPQDGKVKLDGLTLAIWQEAAKMDDNPDNPIHDLAEKGAKYPLSAKQIGFGKSQAERVFAANKTSYDAVQKRLTKAQDAVAATFGADEYDDAPF